MATRKVRYKKLNTKTLLPVLREDQIDPNEYESLTNEQQIATGVEQAEENVSSQFMHFSKSLTCSLSLTSYLSLIAWRIVWPVCIGSGHVHLSRIILAKLIDQNHVTHP